MRTKQIVSLALIALIVFSMVYIGCKNEPPKPPVKPTTTKTEITAPDFSADSALAYVKKQVDFGPRVPNSAAHTSCGNWLSSELKKYGAKLTEQTSTLKAYDGTPLQMRNIIAAFQPEKKERVMLCAHWDTRPFADKDPDKSFEKKPIDGANDGGSGVAVLLEIARQLSLKSTSVGIDIILFDVEDYGAPEFFPAGQEEVMNPNFATSWCLGSQYWSLNKHTQNYNARFGILLDMVGASDAQFNKEAYSMRDAADVVNLIWNTSEKIGFGGLFTDKEVDGVIDDHVMVGRGGVRCVDIIDTRPEIAAMGLGGYKFGPYHHTHKDNIDIIDKNTLKGVGQTLMQVIYNQ